MNSEQMHKAELCKILSHGLSTMINSVLRVPWLKHKPFKGLLSLKIHNVHMDMQIRNSLLTTTLVQHTFHHEKIMALNASIWHVYKYTFTKGRHKKTNSIINNSTLRHLICISLY